MHSNRVPLVVEPIPPESEPPDPDADSVESQSSSDEDLQCQVCNQSFDTERGFLMVQNVTHLITEMKKLTTLKLFFKIKSDQVAEDAEMATAQQHVTDVLSHLIHSINSSPSLRHLAVQQKTATSPAAFGSTHHFTARNL